MIDRKRPGRVLAGDPALNALFEIASAPTVEDFRRLEPGFNRVFRVIRRRVFSKKWGADGLARPVTRDLPLAAAVMDLMTIVESNPVLGDPEARRIRDRFAELKELASNYTYAPGTGPVLSIATESIRTARKNPIEST